MSTTAEPFELDTTTTEITAPLGSMLEAQTRGEIDIQVATAKRFPRSLRTFHQEALEMVTLTEQIAEQCFYALPRDGKTIEGPSARFAEIIASAWGHMRIEGRIVHEDDRFVTGRGVSWDMQRNVAIAYEVRRKITGKTNRKYSDDMVTVTGNAAASIALRNAVLKNIPKAYWEPLYLAARQVAVGNAQTLVDRRAHMLAYFQKMGVPPARVFATLGVTGEADVTLDQLATLKGLATAIKEGDTTVDQAFPPEGAPAVANGQAPERKSADTSKPTSGIATATVTALWEAKTAKGHPKRYEVVAGGIVYHTHDLAIADRATLLSKGGARVQLRWTLAEPFGRRLEAVDAVEAPPREREPGDEPDDPTPAQSDIGF
jgi:hypothetical protein